jgi:hypothetical protein
MVKLGLLIDLNSVKNSLLRAVRRAAGRKLSKFAEFLHCEGLAPFFVALLPCAIVLGLLPAAIKVVNLADGFGFNLQLIWNQLCRQ